MSFQSRGHLNVVTLFTLGSAAVGDRVFEDAGGSERDLEDRDPGEGMGV